MQFLSENYVDKRNIDNSENSPAMLIARALSTGRSPDECRITNDKGNEPAGDDELDPAMVIARSLSDAYTPTDTSAIVSRYACKTTSRSSLPKCTYSSKK